MEAVEIKTPEEHMPGARSVVVVGIHFPATLLERLAKPPAENIGSYTGATQGWGVRQELQSTEFDLVQLLKRSGYQAKIVTDLFGTDYGAEREQGLTNGKNGR